MKSLIPEPNWNNKQRKEGVQVKALLAAMPDRSVEELFAVNPDPPDFVARQGACEWAIEHTRIFRDNPQHERSMKEQEQWIEKYLKLAEKEYELGGSQAVNVDVQFLSNQEFDGFGTRASAVQLAKIVSEIAPSNLRDVDRHVRHELDIPGLTWPKGIAHFSIIRDRGHTQSSWTGKGAEWNGQKSQTSLQAHIDEKNTRRSSYVLDWATAWLVIVAEETGHSSLIDWDEPLKAEYKSVFNQTFLWLNSVGRFYKLKTTPPPGSPG